MQRRMFYALNDRIEQLVRCESDDPDTVLLKKIWWIFVFCCFLFPGIEVITALSVGEYEVAALSAIVAALCLGLLLLFHCHRKNIEGFGLAFQLMIVAVTSVKTLLTGGLVYTAGVVYVGLIGPIQAIIFPNRKRAVFIFLLYIVSVIGSTLAQPYFWPDYKNPGAYFISTYINKFLFGTFFVFFALDYFTSQLRKMKAEEKHRMKELDHLKTKFYTNITHEFRTPLTLILGMADQIGSTGKGSAESARVIKDNGRRLLQLTNLMLDLSKLDAKAMRVTYIQDDIVAYTRYLTEAFHALAANKNIHLAFSSDVPQLVMDFDPDKWQTILSNLLSNALKFTPTQGKVAVRVQSKPGNPAPRFLLSVEDTGIGIPADVQTRVFDRFFQVEHHSTPASEGTGLGLAVTKELVQLLGGTISVHSNTGKGSVFTVSLPLTHTAPAGWIRLTDNQPPTAAAAPQVNGHAAPKSANALSLLLVDDNPDVLNYLASLLRPQYHIEKALNGQEAWEKALYLVPDLVVSDVRMPEMDGFELCRRLKNDLRTSHIPVILLTARADQASKLEGLETGADAYLAKPFDREELLVWIRRLIEVRKILQKRFQQIAAGTGDNSSPLPPKEDVFLNKVREVLENHLTEEEFGIAGLCQQLGMSRSQLYRKFNALTDITVHHYIRDIRLQKARELLVQTDMNVTEVAFAVGFKNLSHFSRVFSEAYGHTPSNLSA